MTESKTPPPQEKQENLPVDKPPQAAHGGDVIARLLVDHGLLFEDQLVYARRVKAKLVSDRSLIGIFKELLLLDNQQLNQMLKQYRLNIRIGDLLV